jgi:hypothetical protein
MKKMTAKAKIAVLFLLPFYVGIIILFLAGMLLFWSFIKLLDVLGIIEALTYLLKETKAQYASYYFKRILSQEDRDILKGKFPEEED